MRGNRTSKMIHVLIGICLVSFSNALLGLRKPYENPANRKPREHTTPAKVTNMTASLHLNHDEKQRNIWFKISDRHQHVTSVESLDNSLIKCSVTSLKYALSSNKNVTAVYNMYSRCLENNGMSLEFINKSDILIKASFDTPETIGKLIKCTIPVLDDLFRITSCSPILRFNVCIEDISRLNIGMDALLQYVQGLSRACLSLRESG